MSTTSACATALVYASGAVVLVGCKSDKEVQEAQRLACLLLESSSTESARISNYALTADWGRKLDLVKIYYAILDSSSSSSSSSGDPQARLTQPVYEVELFPCLTCSAGVRTKVVLFHTGKVIITGCKTASEGDVAKQLLIRLFNFLNQ